MTATLSASLFSSSAKIGDPVFIGVSIDTGGQDITGLDVILYVSSHLEPLAYIPTQLIPVKIFNNLFNPIAFSQIVPPPHVWRGKGLIAVIQCKAISAGTANITFTFKALSTVDSNIAGIGGVDLLTKVVNKRLTIRV